VTADLDRIRVVYKGADDPVKEVCSRNISWVWHGELLEEAAIIPNRATGSNGTSL
jgi:hypothetical protein